MIDRINLKALSYMVIQNLDGEMVEKLEQEDGPDTMDAVRNVIETETPAWVFYYVNERSQELTEPANQIPAVVPKEKFVSKAEEYAGRDNTVIDLTNPASQDWMSEDPMSRPREEYVSRVESIQSALRTVLSDLTEASEDTIDTLAEDIHLTVDPLQWELNRVRNSEDGKATDQRIAELYLATGPNDVVDTVDEHISNGTARDIVDPDVLESYKLTQKELDSKIKRLRKETEE